MPTAINISACEAEEIKYLPNNTVLISINPTYDTIFPLKLDRLDSRILTVRFDDVTADVDKDGIIRKVIDDETTFKILEFINRNLGKDVIVNCRAGISRSAAICLFLHIIHGYELKKGFWSRSRPNPFVLGRLMVQRFMK